MSGRYVLIGLTILTAACHAGAAPGRPEECPGRDVQAIRRRAERNEVALIFYYTSWCDESTEARQVYDDVAAYYGDHVYFAAIDCWHLACNCSRTHLTTVGSGSPHKWPTLVAYYGLHRQLQLQLQYHGDWSFTSLSLFINTLFEPVRRVQSRAELKALLSRSDAVVLALLAPSHTLQYQRYVGAALTWLDTDPERSYRFAVAFGDKAIRNVLNVTSSQLPMLLFISGDRTETFATDERPWNVSEIVFWLQQELKGAYSALHSYSSPISISMKLRQGPVLALFANNQQFYIQMEEALDPGRRQWSEFLACIRLKRRDHLRLAMSRLLHDVREEYRKRQNGVCLRREFLHSRTLQHYYDVNAMLNGLFEEAARSAEQRSAASLESSRLLAFHERNKCLQRQRHDTAELRTTIANYLHQYVNKRAAQLGAPSINDTMSVVVVNSERYRDFLRAQDIAMTPLSSATVFIVDAAKESLFLMQDQYNMPNLDRFLQDYHQGDLLALRKSERLSLSPTPASLSYVRLQELNGQLFLDVLQQENVTTVVLFHSPECALCATLGQTFLQIAAMLRHNSDEIRFARLNIKANDLPWQYVMPTLPALLVFPRGRSAESRLFPAHLRPDLRNVFGFILAQLPPVEQARLAVSSCQRSALPPIRLKHCLQFAKTLIMRHISDHLRFWQLFATERGSILERLRAFKDLSLDVQRHLKG